MKTCEKCGAQLPSSSYELMDYCGICGMNLCDSCMALDHCGHKPAISGTEIDSAEMGSPSGTEAPAEQIRDDSSGKP